jgi:hypothetical protein
MFKVSPGLISAALTVLAMALSFAGKGQLAGFFQSPEAAEAITLLIGSVGTIVSGVLQGVSKKEVVNVEAPAVSRAGAVASLSAAKA